MSAEIETIYEDRRGRMRLKVVRRPGQYGPQYSAIVYRPYKKDEDEQGNPVWEESHWLDEQDILTSRRLHEIADDIIVDAKTIDALNRSDDAA